MSTPELFRKSFVIYEYLIRELQQFYNSLPTLVKKKLFLEKNNQNIGLKKIKHNFSFILQYLLLDISIPSKGSVSYLSMLFISDIGNLDTRLDFYLNDLKKVKHSYLLLPNQSLDCVLDFKKKLYEYINPIKNNMLKFLNVVNTLSKKNIVEERLLPLFTDLYNIFLEINDQKKEELDNAINKTRKIFFDCIKNSKIKIKKNNFGL